MAVIFYERRKKYYSTSVTRSSFFRATAASVVLCLSVDLHCINLEKWISHQIYTFASVKTEQSDERVSQLPVTSDQFLSTLLLYHNLTRHFHFSYIPLFRITRPSNRYRSIIRVFTYNTCTKLYIQRYIYVCRNIFLAVPNKFIVFITVLDYDTNSIRFITFD